jgi:methylenetetrahydrofolate dehydrogenase (NADP+) / methenyltetrahydrofolate cyclohydrolase
VSARLLDGVAVAATIREELRPRIAEFTARAGRPPGLGIVLVGSHAPSEIYVRNKLRAAADIGCRADLVRLPDTATLDEALAAVGMLNHSEAHDGILVQDPLPAAMGPAAAQAVFDSIDPAKDVDGFTPVNAGRLVQNRASLAPCTPSGVIELLEREGVPLSGAHAVVIGRSDIVGKPMAMLLLHRSATVTICHSRTRDLPSITRQADVLVAAVGRTAFVRPDWVKPGATVIDVGINRVTDRAEVEALFPAESKRRADFDKRGAVLVGDVHPAVEQVAGALTPVPGGVGPLTIALLLRNTVTAAEGRVSWSASR